MYHGTFAFLKPNKPEIQEAILERLQEDGFIVIRQEERYLTEKELYAHYPKYVGNTTWFPEMIKYLISGPVTLLILWYGDENSVQALRDLVGPTDPKKGQPGQIRYDFGVHDPNVIFMNAIHASETPEEAALEIERFFPDNPEKSSLSRKTPQQ